MLKFSSSLTCVCTPFAVQSIQNLRILERQRLDALVKGLNVYKNLFDQSIVSIQTALSDLTAAVKSADPSADLDLFRKRSQLATADLTKVPNSPTPEQPFYDNPTLKSAVGCSQQRLLEVPGEHLIFNLQTSSSTLSTGVDSQTSKQVNNAFANHQVSSTTTSNRSGILTDSLTACFRISSRVSMLRGLTNLVQVYAREPAYSDEPTYCEARRRLYVSRVRLTYLTNCRQKSIYSLMCLLSAPGSQSAPDLLPKHIYAEALVRAGFYNLPWISSISPTPGSNSSLPPSAVRWIPLPDLDEETSFRRLSRPLEWPPFPASDAPCEDLNEGLFEWELERLVQRDMEEQTAISAFTGELYWENIDLIDGDTVEDSSLSSVKNGIKEGISSPLMLRRNSNPQFKKSSEISNFGAKDSLLKKTGLTKRQTTEHNVPNRYSSRPSKDIDHSVPSVTDSLTDKANKPVVHDNRSKFLGGSRFRGISIGRNNTTSSKSEANQTSSPPVSPNSFGSSVTSPISVQLSLPSDASSHELKQPTSSRSSFWLRTRLFSRKHSEKEASPSSTHCKQDTDNEHTNLLKLSSDETASNDVLKPMTVLDKSLWPSTISLHCLGWAKVERDYKARTSQELSLQAGDIVSIYRKDNELWWFGELNGTKGRFPVSHVEEF
ncbi:nostrin [Clonorchis sinensis]|uniref:Nostrin n=1 Tax=Clonorchis sinensis TaxID=79923 RepID=G7YQW0_CLOSI|nr:nostrin [Clonorchis sinensis]